jgi:tRNA (guanine-N7-)-methyltransferase
VAPVPCSGRGSADDDRVRWATVFGNAQPVEVEIGPGRGDTLLAAAAARPTRNFFGIERVAGAAESIETIARARGLSNVRVVAGDARCIVDLIGDTSVISYHIYFPDPWPKTRHRHRRLATPDFANAIARTLVQGGAVHMLSDLRPLLDTFVAALTRAGLQHQIGASPPVDRPQTHFEQKYATQGTFYARLVRP